MTLISYSEAEKIISGFSVHDFNDPEKVDAYVKSFGLDQLVIGLAEDAVASNTESIVQTVSTEEAKPFIPELDDLCRLHFIILSRKVLNVLEFGSGFSTAVMASAMAILDTEFAGWASKNLRVEKPFRVFAVEEDSRFAEITRKRLKGALADYAEVSRSSVSMAEHDSRYCTVYDDLPNISPDFIYLDGPSQYVTAKSVNGFSLGHMCRMPMAADILKFEFFLEPGTLILVDGRTANARFLQAYLKRSWTYEHDKAGDIHYFELTEEPLGKFNARKMEFCLGTPKA